MSQITALYNHLLDRARKTGNTQRAPLFRGAAIAVTVKDDTVTLTMGRADKDVGTTEEITFRRDCKVPEGARRIPAQGQKRQRIDNVEWHLIAYQWSTATIAVEEIV